MRLSSTERVLRWIRQFESRFATFGPRATWRWLYGHGVPTVLGIPIIKYHRITESIFVGPQHGRLGRFILRRAGVSIGVSLRTVYNDRENGIGFDENFQLPTEDGKPPSESQLEEGTRLIREAVEARSKVYIHCQTGLGRAPTLAAAYLVNQGLTLNDALSLIRSVRPFTELTGPQQATLKRLAARLGRQGSSRKINELANP